MRKRNKGRALSRPKNQRVALLNSLMGSLFYYDKIKTTEAKAKELKAISEKFITRAKGNKLSDRRILLKSLPLKIVKKLVDEIAPKYIDRQGGYTRIIKMGQRKSDASKVVIIELVK